MDFAQKDEVCSICKSAVDSSSAHILVMGAFGTPRYLCDECSAEIEAATLGRDYDTIKTAANRLSDKIISSNENDKLALDTVRNMLTQAKERAVAIKEGRYDFSEEDEALAANVETSENENPSDEEDEYYGEQIQDFSDLSDNNIKNRSKVSKAFETAFAITLGAAILVLFAFAIYRLFV